MVSESDRHLWQRLVFSATKIQVLRQATSVLLKCDRWRQTLGRFGHRCNSVPLLHERMITVMTVNVTVNNINVVEIAVYISQLPPIENQSANSKI